MRSYMRLIVYPVVGPPVTMLLWITTIIAHGCLTGDRCWLPEVYHPALLFGILGIGYIFGIVPAVIGGLIVAILESKRSFRSRWVIFALGCLAALSTIVWGLPMGGGKGGINIGLQSIVPFLLVAGFFAMGGVGGLAAEWVHRKFVARPQAEAAPG